MFYETAFPLNTPKSAAVNSADPCCYENTDYFTRSRVALLAEEDKAGFLSSTIVEVKFGAFSCAKKLSSVEMTNDLSPGPG